MTYIPPPEYRPRFFTPLGWACVVIFSIGVVCLGIFLAQVLAGLMGE